jgi:hypothetical protein
MRPRHESWFRGNYCCLCNEGCGSTGIQLHRELIHDLKLNGEEISELSCAEVGEWEERLAKADEEWGKREEERAIELLEANGGEAEIKAVDGAYGLGEF